MPAQQSTSVVNAPRRKIRAGQVAQGSLPLLTGAATEAVCFQRADGNENTQLPSHVMIVCVYTCHCYVLRGGSEK